MTILQNTLISETKLHIYMEYSNTILYTNVQSIDGKCFKAAAKLIKKKNPVYLYEFKNLTKLLINSSLVIYLLFFTQAFFKTKFCIPKQLLWSAMCSMHAICRICTSVSLLPVQGRTHAVLCCGRPQHFKTRSL